MALCRYSDGDDFEKSSANSSASSSDLSVGSSMALRSDVEFDENDVDAEIPGLARHEVGPFASIQITVLSLSCDDWGLPYVLDSIFRKV